MIKIGITGQSGFVGTHLANRLSQCPDKYQVIKFEDDFFKNSDDLRNFVKQCDVIVHLAAMMRSTQKGVVYNTNMSLIQSLISAMEYERVNPDIFFASSIQENNGSEYGQCKLDGKIVLREWAIKHGSGFGCMIFPNLFGPYAKPNSHSFIATFCYKLVHEEDPQILIDNVIPLKYITTVIDELISYINETVENKSIGELSFKADYNLKVSTVLSILKSFHNCDIKGIVPELNTAVERDLYQTYNSYKDKI